MERPLLRFFFFSSYLGQQYILRTQSSVSHQDSCVASGKSVISSPNGQDGWMVKKFDFFKWSLLVLPEPPDPLDYSPPGSYINGVLQTRILLSFPSPVDLPKPGIKPGCSALQADSLPLEPPGKPSKLPTPHPS